MQELWLFQALTESYIPLIQCFNELVLNNTFFNITFSVSPTLIYMLNDDYYKDKYSNYISTLIHILEKKSSEASERGRKEALLYLLSKTKDIHSYYSGINGDILKELQKLHLTGRINLITCAATHAVLPMFRSMDDLVHDQIETAQAAFENCFGFVPEGFWLPEMGYYSGLDKILEQYNINYTFLETHSAYLGHKKPSYGSYYPSVTDNGLIIFPRDLSLSNEVWSADSGYPGDYNYREFHFDFTYSLTNGELTEFGIEQLPFGLKIYRITGKNTPKDYYQSKIAEKITGTHAQDFFNKITERSSAVRSLINKTPVFTLPFDTELFGHWWYEGPQFLKKIIIKISSSDIMELVHPARFINDNLDLITPAESSWGNGGFFKQWTSPECSWIYTELAKLNIRLKNLKYPGTDAHIQAFKEILLASSSDWTFFMANNTSADYGEERLKDHIASAEKIISDIENSNSDPDFIQKRKKLYPVFDNILLHIYNKAEKIFT